MSDRAVVIKIGGPLVAVLLLTSVARAQIQRTDQLADTRVDVDFVTFPIGAGGPVVAGAPYSAEAVTEFVQTLADGNRILRESSATVYRDAVGRTRREQGLAMIGNAVGRADKSTKIQIQDPQAGRAYLLDLEGKIAHQLPSASIAIQPGVRPPAGGATFEIPLPPPVPPPPLGDGQGAVFFQRKAIVTSNTSQQVEQLGKMMIEGVAAEGTRSTMTIPAGQIGNERPITVVSERWYSPELQALVMSRQSDPRFGETTYRLTNIVRTDPPPDLFVVPPDFTIVEAPAGPGVRMLRIEKP